MAPRLSACPLGPQPEALWPPGAPGSKDRNLNDGRPPQLSKPAAPPPPGAGPPVRTAASVSGRVSMKTSGTSVEH